MISPILDSPGVATQQLRPNGEATAISIVVPTFNERANIRPLVEGLQRVIDWAKWEVLFVDDNSPDGTAAEVREVARINPAVRLISRHNRRGLSSAVVEGILAASCDIIVVMDGDLQHDESIIRNFFDKLTQTEAEMVTASRFLLEHGADGLSSESRVKVSENGIRLANRVFGLELTDPLTGFFAIKRECFERALPNLSAMGFKIVLDLMVSAQPRPRVVEVPFVFRKRVHGESKLDARVLYDFLLFFVDKTICRRLPISARLLSFCAVGALGVVVHMLCLTLVTTLLGFEFIVGQTVGTVVAIVMNYTLNNVITYADKRRRGLSYLIGLAKFSAVCGIGVIANIGVASYLHDHHGEFTIYLHAMAGILVGVAWNYLISSLFVWNTSDRI